MTLPICFQQKTLYARGQGGQGTMTEAVCIGERKVPW